MSQSRTRSPTWSINPPAQLLRDPAYIAQSASRQRALTLLTSILILVCNPPFRVVLTSFPGMPEESWFTRVLPMVLAAIAIPYHWKQRSYTNTRVTIIALLTTQLVCSFTQTIETGNSPVYVAATLTPIYACQMIFNRITDLLIVLGLSLGCYLVLFSGIAQMTSSINLLALTMFSTALMITGLFGIIRIKDLEQTYLTQYESDRKSVALEQAESNARHSAEAALAASRAKSAFLATMSHELRTPLNAIIGYSELLLETAEDEGHEALTEDLERINTSADHLLTLISGVLDLSKVEAGRMELVLGEVELATLTKEIEQIGNTLAKTHHNRLVVEIAPDAPLTLYTDAQKVRQIMLNLLSNAFKFTEEGTITLRVRAHTAQRVVFEVQDTGIGISPDQQEKLFQAFSQVHGKSERERYGGTGLGLMLCKRMAELLDGTLEVSSTLHEGSTFTLCVPIALPEPTHSEVS